MLISNREQLEDLINTIAPKINHSSLEELSSVVRVISRFRSSPHNSVNSRKSPDLASAVRDLTTAEGGNSKDLKNRHDTKSSVKLEDRLKDGPTDRLSITLDQICSRVSTQLYVLTDPDEFLEIALAVVSSGHTELIQELLEHLNRLATLNRITSPKQLLASFAFIAHLSCDLSTDLLSFEGPNSFALIDQTLNANDVNTTLSHRTGCPDMLLPPVSLASPIIPLNRRMIHLSRSIASMLASKLSSHVFLRSVNIAGLIQLLRDLAWIGFYPTPAVPSIGEQLILSLKFPLDSSSLRLTSIIRFSN